jgi:hypothetical protein
VIESPQPTELLQWHKSSASQNNGCVEVAVTADQVLVRDTKDRPGPVLRFTHDEWRAFLAGAGAGEFDLPA